MPITKVLSKWYFGDCPVAVTQPCRIWKKLIRSNASQSCILCHLYPLVHDDVIKWKHFRVTGFLSWEFTGHRWIPLTKPVTRSFDFFFDLGLDKRLNKASRRRWFETSSRSLWRHCRALIAPNHNKTQQNEPSAYNIWDLVYSTSLVTTGEHVTVGRYHSGRGLSQCETTLNCNVVSHWLSPCAEWYLSQAPL